MKKDENGFVVMEKNEKLLLWIVIVPFFFLGSSLVYRVQYLLCGMDQSRVSLLATELITDLLLFLMCLVLFRKFLFESAKALVKSKMGNGLMWAGIGVIMSYAFQFLIAVVFAVTFVLLEWDYTQLQLTYSNQGIINYYANQNAFVVALCAVVLAPIAEELVFRGGVFRVLRRWNTALAMIGSAAAFAFVHIIVALSNENKMGVIFAFCVYWAAGMAHAVLYEKKKNIILNIFMHTVINLIGALRFLI